MFVLAGWRNGLKNSRTDDCSRPSKTQRKAIREDMLKVLSQGANEHDLVQSGLEETMLEAYQEIRDTKNRLDGKVDLRTASFVNSINKIALCYGDMGIFP